MGLFSRRNQFPVEGRTVIVTGGSQGMGRGVAKLLAQKGAHVVIVARTAAKLEAAVKYISSAARNPQTQRFHHISADLTNPSEAQRVISETTTWNHGAAPDIVFCCAGGSHPDLFIATPLSKHREQMDQNYWSAAYMAHAVLQSWLTPTPSPPNHTQPPPPPRHLIFTSSVIAFYPFVGYSVYAPAKAALRALSDALAQEILLYNGARRRSGQGEAAPAADVRVHSVFPATILTEGYAAENIIKPAVTKKLEEGDKGQTEDEVAVESVRALERGEYLVTTSLIGWAMKGTALGGSARGLADVLMGWVASIVILFVQWDFNAKVFKWGKERGVPESLDKGR